MRPILAFACLAPCMPTEPLAEQPEVLAEALVQFRGDTITQHTLDGPEAERLLSPRRDLGCPAPPCGVAHLPAGAPVEAGFWIALADLYAQGDAAPRLRSSQRDEDQTTTQALRFLLTFQPTPDVRCAAQARLYGDERAPKVTGEGAVRAWRRRRGLSARAPTLSAPVTGQIVLRVLRTAGGGFITEVHRGGEVDDRRRGEAFDQVVVCRSARPLWASTLEGHRYASVMHRGGLKVQVWRAPTEPPRRQ